MKPATIGVLVFALLMMGLVRHEERELTKQRQIINDLIELNHDKSVYIDSGCRVPYEGTEEMLPREAKVLQ